MKWLTHCLVVRLIVFVTCIACCTTWAVARSPVKMTKLTGTVDLSAQGPTPFTLAGVASHLGNYQAEGEVEFLPGEEEGSLIGKGVVVFQAANGDLLVGEALWEVAPGEGDARPATIRFIWADSVEFGDGSVVANTGRFTDNRPPGLIIRTITLSDIIILILRG